MKVYFDNAATTPIHPQVLEKMNTYLSSEFGNPSSTHSFGRSARVAVEESREVVAEFINAKPSEVFFTSGGTEANNFVIFGIAKTVLGEDNRNQLITSNAEHHCVLDSYEQLEKQGYNIKLVDVDANTSVSIDLIKKEISNSTSLVSLMHVNNETGSFNPIEEIGVFLNSKKIFFNTDAVQSFGKIQIDVQKLGIDTLCGSAHKINGPKGTGFAYIKSGTPISPLLFGGSQERNRRGGTENVAGIVGLAEAVRLKMNNMQRDFNQVALLKNKLVEGILTLDSENITINGSSNSAPYIVSITLNSEKYLNDAEAMIMFLDINGLAVSNGSACTSGTIKTSHVIMASGYKPEDAAGTIRFSFGPQNNLDEVIYALEVIQKMLKKFSK